MNIKKSNHGSVSLIGDDFLHNGQVVFVPLNGFEASTFLQMVNNAEAKASRRLSLGEVTRIAEYVERNGE